jgi:tRNA modification GTPase
MIPGTVLLAPAQVCVLTPESRGAVATVRVWGSAALAVVDRVFRPARGSRLADSAVDRPRFGRIGEGTGDEVVAVIVGGHPAEVEVHCHGGPAALALVVEAIEAAGAQRRSPTAWIAHHSGSAIEAEARIDLARAPTVRTAEILLEQSRGALAREVASMVQRITTNHDDALAGIDRLLTRAAVGLRLISGWSVALAGRPNVGKSRLLNALAGYERAIVDPAAGTTRDVVTVRTAFDGWPVELADTAGLRDACDAVEAAGIALARAQQARSDLILLVLDRSEPLTPADHALLATLRDPLIVANKADLPAAWEPWDESLVTVSAERGDGLERLIATIARRLVPSPIEPGAGVPFRSEHVRRLEAARAALQAGDVAGAAEVLAGVLAAPAPAPAPAPESRGDGSEQGR